MMTAPDPTPTAADQHTLATERLVIAEILMARTPDECMHRIATLAQHCPAPLWRWFTDPLHQVLAIGFDEVQAGRADASQAGIVERMATCPRADALELRKGTLAGAPGACPPPESALAWVGGYAAIGDLVEAATMAGGQRDVAANAKLLRGAGKRRQAADLVREIGKRIAASSAATGPDEALAWAQERMTALLATAEDRSLGDCLTEALDNGAAYAALRDQGHAMRASWGIRELDLLCPMRPGGLYVLAAEPGGGKTSLALQAAAATAGDVGTGAVAIASLEMTGGELATILAGRQAGVSPASIREHAPTVSDETWIRLRELAATWSESPSVLVRDSAAMGESFSVDALAGWLTQRRHASPRMALAVLDYLQLLDPTNPRWTEYQTITHASRRLKRAAQALRLPVLCLSQMNREGRRETKDRQGQVTGRPEPTLGDLRGSGSIEQDADAVVFLHVVGNPDPTAPTILVRAIVAKQRGGARGSVDLWFHRRHQLLTSAPGARDANPENAFAIAGRSARLASPPDDSEDVF